MKYRVKTTKRFDKKLRKLDKPVQKLILSYLMNNLEGTENPYLRGKALSGDLQGLWRYRIADYRIIAEIRNQELIIIALNLGHRRDIYDKS